MNLVLHPNNMLRKKCTEVDFNEVSEEELENIGRQMLEIMYNNNGVGLAHPQVGGNSRIFVMDNKNSNEIIINPEVEKKSAIVEKEEEGCLSFPDLWMPVKRAKTILAKWQKPNGHIRREFFSDFDARCFQHELDHLDGICFDKRVSKLVLDRAKNKKRKLSKHGR